MQWMVGHLTTKPSELQSLIMNELDILRTVRIERQAGAGGAASYSYEKLREDLSILGTSADLSDSVISSILNGRTGGSESKILSLITGPSERARAAQAAIERSLGLPGLFHCKSRGEVIALLTKVDGAIDTAPRIVVMPDAPAGDIGIIQAEADAIQHLCEVLIHGGRPIQHWDAPFNAGSSTVVHGLWDALVEHSYSAIWILRPSSWEYPYEAEFGCLRQALNERGHYVATRGALANSIVAENLLVILLSPAALDFGAETNSARGLIREFNGRQSSWSGVANLLVVGQSEWMSKLKVLNRDNLSTFLKRRLRLEGEAAFVEFQAQWRRFSGLREDLVSELSGSRMRRAATYFRVQNPDPVWPMSVKLRALFATNDRHGSYYDPTQGLRRLAGQVYFKFDDIAGYVDDVSDYIQLIRHADQTARGGSRGKRRYLYLLQYVSTSLHWLTEEALECLIDKIGKERPNRLNLETEKKRLATLSPMVVEKQSPVSGVDSSRYFSGIGVKAVVQDDWIDTEPRLRSLAHYRIAWRLKTHENDKNLLGREFPYEPHWGRSRIFFLGETIRHLIRSCETYEGEVSYVPGEYKNEFPGPPPANAVSTDPSHVINYCYTVLYQELLNGNANGKASRSLAKRYGAYHFSVEMLELISDDNEVGVPHRALKPELRLEFTRECGFALLDIGELDKAKRAFERAKAEARANGSAIDELEVQLDLVLLNCVCGDLNSAGMMLASAELDLATIHVEGKKLDARSFLQIRKAFRRLLTRKAHLAFLLDDFGTTLDILDQLENEARWSELKIGSNYDRNVLVPSFSSNLEAEQIHLKVAALHRRNEARQHTESRLGDAIELRICFQAMLSAESNGLHHQAMGFRIAVARCFRRARRLDIAEVFLDSVHVDLLRYGCSERTFLSFLNEAGRVLADRDPIRAYATYLRPCLARAKARGFMREAQQAAAQALIVLTSIEKDFKDVGELGEGADLRWEEKLETAVAGHRELINSTEYVFSGDMLERDPLYAYAIVDAENIIRNLCDATMIEIERNNINGFFSESEAGKGSD